MNKKLNYQKPSVITIEAETNILCNSNYNGLRYGMKDLDEKCPYCNTYVNTYDIYCSQCGKKL